MKFITFFTLFLLLWWGGCTTQSRLSATEKQKLDPDLRRLLENPENSPPQLTALKGQDGKTRYRVIIHIDHPKALQQAGIVINSRVGNRVTALVTLKQLRQLVRLPEVNFVESGSKTYPK